VDTRTLPAKKVITIDGHDFVLTLGDVDTENLRSRTEIEVDRAGESLLADRTALENDPSGQARLHDAFAKEVDCILGKGSVAKIFGTDPPDFHRMLAIHSFVKCELFRLRQDRMEAVKNLIGIFPDPPEIVKADDEPETP
jgi:hypothetical protein